MTTNVIMGFLSFLFVASLSMTISMSIISQRDTDNLVIKECPIINCTKWNFTYQWPIAPYYNASYQARNGTINCNGTIRCGLDNRWPEATFGGWIYKTGRCPKKRIQACINGTCNLRQYPLFVAMISAVFLLVSIIGFIMIITRFYRGRNEYVELKSEHQ
jgi:hypothetical protein